MNFIKKILLFYTTYQKLATAKLQSSYFEYLKFKLGLQKSNFPSNINYLLSNHNKIYVGINSLVGSPAKILKELDPNKFIPWKDEEEFYGFIPKKEYEQTKEFKQLKSKLNKI